MTEVFEQLSSLNVNGHTETKKTGGTNLTYLSWPWAWAETKKRFPNASYEIKQFDGLPYVGEPDMGYMVFTSVTIDGITHSMWLPVMDNNNRAMKAHPYTIKTKYSEINVAACDMFAVNKTIMRCLVKNLAMFGLGLYIYAGEDLPESEAEETTDNAPVDVPFNYKAYLSVWLAQHKMNVAEFASYRQAAIADGFVDDIASSDMTKAEADKLFNVVIKKYVK